MGLWCGLILALFVSGLASGSVHAQTVPAPSVQTTPSEVPAPVSSADAAPGKDKKPAAWWAAVAAYLQGVVSIATSILVIVSYLALFAAAIILFCFVCRELRKKIVIIEPFEVPPSVAATGLTGAALVTQIKQRIDEIRRADTGLSIRPKRRADGRTAPPVDFRMETVADLIIVEASLAGFSTRDFLSLLRRIFNGPPSQVSGHLVVKESAYFLLMEVRSQSTSRIFQVDSADIWQAAAEKILSVIDRGALANYYAETWKLDKLLDLADELIGSNTSRDALLQGWNLRGFVALQKFEIDRTTDNARHLYLAGEKIAKLSPSSAAARLYQGVAAPLYRGEEGRVEAIRLLKSAVEIDRFDLEARFYLAFELEDQDRYADALLEYDCILSLATLASKSMLRRCWILLKATSVFRKFRPTVAVDPIVPDILAGHALYCRASIHRKSEQGLQAASEDYDKIIRWGENSKSANWETLVSKAMLGKAVIVHANDSKEAVNLYDALIDRYGARDETVLVEQTAKALIARLLALRTSKSKAPQTLDPTDSEFQALVTEWQTRNPAVAAQLLPVLLE